MKNTIKTIALSVAFLSGTGMAYAQGDETPTDVTVDTGLIATLDSISQQVENGSALNLAVNTGDVDASVDINSEAGTLETITTLTGAIETTAIGAANTGNIELEQGSLNTLVTGEFEGGFEGVSNQLDEEITSDREWTSDIDRQLSGNFSGSFENQLDETLSNYSAANIAYNSGQIDASVSATVGGAENEIGDITTTAIGAVNSGSITVTVK